MKQTCTLGSYDWKDSFSSFFFFNNVAILCVGMLQINFSTLYDD